MSCQDKTIQQILILAHQFSSQVQQELKCFGVTEPQYNVLRIIQEAGGEPVSLQHVQSQMLQKSSNITRIIDKLLEKGFVNRQECPNNRRKIDLTLTKVGCDRLKTFDKKVQALHQQADERLSTKEKQTLESLLDKLLDE